ncbi:hypothetical protein IWQ61_009830 [Dispira simplex]|nr:hypothetical protein IWQ61_009830 [Dispira simplex]
MDGNTLSNILNTLQTKIIEGQKQLAAVRAQLQMHEREKRRNELTLKEVDTLPSQVTTYKSVGKMFLQVGRDSVVKDLKKSMAESDDLRQGLEKKQKYLEREVADCQNSLRDILHHSKAQV